MRVAVRYGIRAITWLPVCVGLRAFRQFGDDGDDDDDRDCLLIWFGAPLTVRAWWMAVVCECELR